MSDDEESKKSGYRLEVSANNRAACKGPKPCTGTKILKGEVRLGSLVDFRGHTTWSWKHWRVISGCASKKVIENMKKKHPDPEDIDGYEYLNPTQQAKIRTAWETGHVADEDIPPSARKPEGEGGDEEEEEEEEETGKKKKKKAPAKKRTAKQDEVRDDDVEAIAHI
ncbi:uncharacterized protein EI90DRAFT_2937645 [Cantharellus anzutake]|uniref:uncharacterized protein n=1 Tax=Cantharellus anzutake TaxID=1750568 RepID=UPI001906E108|nr:uncharacterized protein EI90DRAFT_2937645 [Cantharellus anzutake]KAF8321988.1 hypothetical protein EI90DRAFT_2937645 [Cantharellus anzutake]